jgi:hypothetical protein
MTAAKREYAVAERATKAYMEECSSAGQNLPENLDEAYKEIVSRWKQAGLDITLDELEEKIAEEEGRAEAIRFANPDAMRNYTNRKAEVPLTYIAYDIFFLFLQLDRSKTWKARLNKTRLNWMDLNKRFAILRYVLVAVLK